MVSVNNLVGSGKAYIDNQPKEAEEEFKRCWLFHAEHPEGILVKTQAQYDKIMLESGWVDHPGKCTLLPGHEHLFEGDKGTSIEEVEEITGDEFDEE